MKKLAILTSGGDAPGMNCAIHNVVKRGEELGVDVYGINNGYQGLIEEDYTLLHTAQTEPYEARGGTLLGTSRCPSFMETSVRQAAAESLKEADFDGLIVIGGEGSYKGALSLHQLGIPVVALPGTIDNDIPHTDQTIGFYTAVKSVVSNVDQVKTTAASHGLIFAVEVMGRHAPDIAYWAGNALDVEGIIYRPEDVDIQKIVKAIQKSKADGKKYQIFIVAEGIMSANAFVEILKSQTNYEIRGLNLGHIQRGGAPAALDRLLAKAYALKAVDYLNQGQSGSCLALKGKEIVVQDLESTVQGCKNLILPFFI